MFCSSKDLLNRLRQWNPSYINYADKLWLHGITTSEQIAHAEVADLAPLTGGNMIHAADMIKQAQREGVSGV